MSKRIIIFVLIILSSISFVIIGCSSKSSIPIWEEMDKIKLEVVSKQELRDGINYIITLKNGSSLLIKHNTVYVSYSVKNGNNSHVSNKAKVEADGNKIDIRPGEEVTLNAFIPSVFDTNKVDQRRLQYEIKGYIDQVKDINHFGQSGEILN
ncbi:hypothetical protein [Desulfosporosinus nitroreducens]|uniref:hypothetical protein n=1 Tax=Desulfosporosinus nitroreducens TaxID=2018668 RepID=UPI00207CD86C|nr:hypothetical protein [Desulfosporosinus nitroreducens]MCO1603497.1 hypothetical protein [Desulfosporosinus nitroreducens]